MALANLNMLIRIIKLINIHIILRIITLATFDLRLRNKKKTNCFGYWFPKNSIGIFFSVLLDFCNKNLFSNKKISLFFKKNYKFYKVGNPEQALIYSSNKLGILWNFWHGPDSSKNDEMKNEMFSESKLISDFFSIKILCEL